MEKILSLLRFFLVAIQFLWILVTQFCYYYFIDNNKSNNLKFITQRLSNINILYVKLFQGLSLNEQFFSDELNDELIKFTDHAPWTFKDLDLKTIHDVIYDNDLKMVDHMDQPMNSGMISLVYRVKDRNDKQFILKIKRKGIDSKLKHAIDDIINFIDIISFLPFIKRFNIQSSVEKSTDMILSQLDFACEVSNIITFNNNCKNLDYITIPQVNDEITVKYPNVILMEFIEGSPINKIDKCDYKYFAPLVVKFGLVTSFFHGISHGDLHMGNILFIKKDDKYKIGILDFGIVYKLDSKLKEVVFKIINDYNRMEPEEMARNLLSYGVIEPIEIIQNLPKERYDELLHMLGEIMGEFFSKTQKANQLMIYKFLERLHEFLKHKDIINLNLKPSSQFVQSQVSIAMAQGVTAKLIEGEDLTDYFDKIISQLFHLDLITDD